MSLKKVLCVVMLFSLVAGSVVAQKRVQLKIASMAPSRSPWDIEQRALAQEWAEITNGLVSVTFYDTLHSMVKRVLFKESGPPDPVAARCSMELFLAL